MFGRYMRLCQALLCLIGTDAIICLFKRLIECNYLTLTNLATDDLSSRSLNSKESTDGARTDAGKIYGINRRAV